MISVSSVDFLLIYGITGRQRSHADHDDYVDDADHVAGNDDTFSFVENTFGVITATRSLFFFCFSPFLPTLLCVIRGSHASLHLWELAKEETRRRRRRREKVWAGGNGIGKCLRAAAFSPLRLGLAQLLLLLQPSTRTRTRTRWGFKCTWMIAWAIALSARRMRQKWIVAQGLNATEVCRRIEREDAIEREDDAADYLLSPV